MERKSRSRLIAVGNYRVGGVFHQSRDLEQLHAASRIAMILARFKPGYQTESPLQAYTGRLASMPHQLNKYISRVTHPKSQAASHSLLDPTGLPEPDVHT